MQFFLHQACYMLLCCRQKCVNTLTLFKRDAKGLYQEQTGLFSIQHIKGDQWLIVGMLDSKIVSEYDQEIPQSQTADNPVVPRGRAV